MKTGPRFCVVGSLNYETIPGGKGANQAVSIARLGESVSLIGKVGRDEFGTALPSKLSAEGINVAGVHVAAAVKTGCAFILVAESGRNMIVVSPGANAAWTEAEAEDASRCAAASACVLLQGEIPPFVNLAAARAARAANSRVIWNPAPASLDRELLALTDVVIPNELEAFQLAVALKRPTESIRDAASTLLDHGPGAVVVTVGSEGAWLATREGSARFPARSVQAVDTTAAGDAFVGGMAVALFRGLGLPQAVTWGNAAGALAASRWGAQPSLPTAEELRTLVEAL